MRATTLLISSSLAALAAAADGTTTISHLGGQLTGSLAQYAEYTSFVGSVVGADSTATTYHIRCQDDAPSSLCAINSKTPWTMIQGPATYSADLQEDISTAGASATVTANVACSFTHSSESVVCSQTFSYELSYDGESTAISTDIPSASIPPAEVTYDVLTVTGDLAKLTASATGSSGDAAATGKSASSTGGAQPMITAAPLAAAAAAAIAALL